MEKIYKFKGKGLFILAGFICFATLILAPVGLVFIYMAFTAKIVMKNEVMFYKMLSTREIKYAQITKIALAKKVSPRYYIAGSGGFGWINCVTVIPLVIEYAGKKVKISSNFFEGSKEIVQTLIERSGKELEVTPDQA